MNRRKFIGTISVGTIAIIAGSFISFSGFDKTIEEIITEEMRKLELKVADKEVESFIKGARNAGLWNSFSFRKIELIKWSSRLEKLNLFFLLPGRYNWYKQEITRQFLFSSTFFYNGMDESKPIHYLRIYNPYSTPCCNPFSNLYYSA